MTKPGKKNLAASVVLLASIHSIGNFMRSSLLSL